MSRDVRMEKIWKRDFKFNTVTLRFDNEKEDRLRRRRKKKKQKRRFVCFVCLFVCLFLCLFLFSVTSFEKKANPVGLKQCPS